MIDLLLVECCLAASQNCRRDWFASGRSRNRVVRDLQISYQQGQKFSLCSQTRKLSNSWLWVQSLLTYWKESVLESGLGLVGNLLNYKHPDFDGRGFTQ